MEQAVLVGIPQAVQQCEPVTFRLRAVIGLVALEDCVPLLRNEAQERLLREIVGMLGDRKRDQPARPRFQQVLLSVAEASDLPGGVVER
jgi:hypothetical protein